jgi:Domain of unknown function (DUF1918)
MAVVGDRVQVPSKRVGQAPRDGVVTGVSGSLLRVAWSGGEESTIFPSMGSLVVVGKVRARAKKSAPTAKAPARKTSGVPAKKAPAKRALVKKTAKSSSKKAAKKSAGKTTKGSDRAKGGRAAKTLSKRSGKAAKRRK